MKKIIKYILIVLILIWLISYTLYKNNSTVNNIVNIQLMNMRETTKFEIKGSEIYMNGLINSQTYNQFVKIIEKNPQIKTIVEINMEGSIDDDTMIKLAYYVRKKRLNTKLLSFSDINSGAVDLFLAWVERTMEQWAHIWVHSWSDNFKEAKDFPKSAKEHEQNRKYIEDMLWKDDFYWFTIYAAPANGIYEMSEEEIKKYGLLTKPIIRENLTGTTGVSGVMNNNFGKYLIGNINSDTIIINSQGGPILEFSSDEIIRFLYEEGKINLNKTAIINIHQEQTLRPWKFRGKEITFEQAKKYDEKSVKRLSDTIKYFKNKGKKVYVVGTSFGAFVVQDSLATHGNIADKYLIIVGRLNMPKEVWSEFSKGNYVGFEYDKNGIPKIIPFNAEQAGMGGGGSIEDKNMAKLAAGLWYKRYITLLKNINLSNVIYIYGKKDQQVGNLNKKEVEFLKSKNVKILEWNGGHGETAEQFTGEALKSFNNN